MDDGMTGRRTAGPACVLAAGLALASCSQAGGTACPAIGWSNAVTVALADGWPPVDGGTLLVGCSSPCGTYGREGPADELSVPLEGRSTLVHLDMTAPGSVTVSVLGADGAELAVHDVGLDWRRVGGSEECGGPHAASVVVPAP